MKKVIKAIGDNTVNNGNNISLTFRFSDRCNYKCEYCTYHDNTEPFETLEYYINYVNKVLNLLDFKDRIDIYIHGGEPTIIPDFDIIIKEMVKHKNVKDIIIQTNLSQPISYFEKFINIDDIVTFSCSYQHHMNLNKNFESEYFNKVLFLIKHKLFYIINLSLEGNYVDDIQNIIKFIDSHEVIRGKIIYNYIDIYENLSEEYIGVKNIIDNSYFDDKEYAVEVFFGDNTSTKYKNYNNLRQDGYNKYKNFKCTAGNKNLILQPNGDVYYCLSHHHYKPTKPICNIFKDEKLFKIVNSKYCLCTFPTCVCEIWLEKSKINS